MLTCKHTKFTLSPQITYLNCAYMAPLLKSVEKEGVKGVRRKRNPATITPEDFFLDTETLRSEFAQLINVQDSKRIVVIPSVSYGIANVTKNLNLKRNDKVIVAAEQFPSNYYPWQKLCMEQSGTLEVVVPPRIRESRGKEWNDRILNAIDASTRAVALGQVHWTDGTLFNLEAIRKRTQEVGALLIIDGTQSVGALPFDVAKIQPDALICAGYKWLLGPYSMGLAYYGDYFDGGDPIENNWINRFNSEDFASLIYYQDDYQPGALRYEVGEHSNFIMVPMMLKAIQQIRKWGVENIQDYCKHVTKGGLALLKQKGFWVEDEAYRSNHLVGIRLPEHINIAILKEQLVKKKIYISVRGDAIRLSPHVYNKEEDMNKLVKILLT